MYYRCSGAHSGGTCSNRRPVRQDVLEKAALAELRRVLTATDLYDKIRKRVAGRLKTFTIKVDQERERLEPEVSLLPRFLSPLAL